METTSEAHFQTVQSFLHRTSILPRTIVITTEFHDFTVIFNLVYPCYKYDEASENDRYFNHSNDQMEQIFLIWNISLANCLWIKYQKYLLLAIRTFNNYYMIKVILWDEIHFTFVWNLKQSGNWKIKSILWILDALSVNNSFYLQMNSDSSLSSSNSCVLHVLLFCSKWHFNTKSCYSGNNYTPLIKILYMCSFKFYVVFSVLLFFSLFLYMYICLSKITWI